MQVQVKLPNHSVSCQIVEVVFHDRQHTLSSSLGEQKNSHRLIKRFAGLRYRDDLIDHPCTLFHRGSQQSCSSPLRKSPPNPGNVVEEENGYFDVPLDPRPVPMLHQRSKQRSCIVHKKHMIHGKKTRPKAHNTAPVVRLSCLLDGTNRRKGSF